MESLRKRVSETEIELGMLLSLESLCREIAVYFDQDTLDAAKLRITLDVLDIFRGNKPEERTDPEALKDWGIHTFLPRDSFIVVIRVT